MSIDKRLLDILCCPESKQPVALATSRQLAALNEAQTAGRLVHVDGSAVEAPFAAALVTADARRVYRIDDGIPVMLIDLGVETRQIADFPR